MNQRILKFWAALCCIGFLVQAHAQQLTKSARLAAPPTIDGIINDDEWKDANTFEGLHDENTGASYADGGKFWLGYDKNYIYFAARLTESEPNSIRATEYRTNVGLRGDDSVELDVDLSGSLSAFNSFRINPNGATNISIAGGRAAKREWLGAIIAKGHITSTGWECEARIPWQAMSIPKGGRRNIRFNILRSIAKNQRQLAYTFVPQTQTGLTPTWAEVELPKPEVDRSLKLLPYGYAGYDAANGKLFNGGIDMKTSLTDQVNMVGSINPDFRNIENSVLSLDFSRFERIANETRPFFQEGNQYAESQLFLSQRIKQFSAGLNTYGRINDTASFSFIGVTQPGKESDLVFNASEDPSPNTSFHFTATDLQQPGLINQSHLIRLSQNYGAFNLFLRQMGSNDTITGSGNQSDAFLSYQQQGWGFMGGYTTASKSFNPRLGYVQEVDLKGAIAGLEYAKSLDKGVLSDYSFDLSATSFNHQDGTFYRTEGSYGLRATIRGGLNFQFSADLADFQGSKDSLYSYRVSYPRGNPYANISVGLDQGKQAGFSYRSLGVSTSYRAAKGLQLSLREQHVDYQGAADQTIFTTAYDLGKDRSIAGRLVRQDNQVNAYLAYQRSGNEGIEYFLILGDPNASKYRNSITLKLVIPITIGGRRVPKETKKN
jgi:hypothetical protein